MTAKLLRNNYLLILLIFVFQGCFKEDTPIEAVVRRGIHISNSIYYSQSFYDLSTDSVVSSPNPKWDLAFENLPTGWHVQINYSNFSGIYRTGSGDFNATSYITDDKKWLYDASSGNPDSTAVGNWRQLIGEGKQVYLLGTYDGVHYKPFRKLQFSSVTDTSYTFAFANLDNSDKNEVTIRKNPVYNYTYFSFTSKDTVKIEPGKNSWDILFTQYTTTLFTKEDVPTPYIVRGVYLNPNNVAAMMDTLTGYSNITAQNVIPTQLSTIQDYIGYNWKSVEINQSANTAHYAVRLNYSYIIRDTKGEYYKLRFLSYVNDSLLVGYPVFEKEKLN